METTRRAFLVGGAAVAAGLFAGSASHAAQPMASFPFVLPPSNSPVTPALLARVRAALAQHAGRVTRPELVAVADDPETRRRVEAERRCVAVVGGGCLAPVAAHHDGVILTALVAAEDGTWVERAQGDDPEALGRELASLAR